MKNLKKWYVLLLTALLLGMLGVPGNIQAKSVKKVKLNKTSVSLTVGKTTKLKLKRAPKGKKVTWSSNRKKVASVTKKGKVTAKKAGRAKITAKQGKKIYTCMVTVKNKRAAAKTKKASSAKYTMDKVNKSKTFKHDGRKGKAVVYFKKPVLKGKSKAVKAINKSINKESNRFLNSEMVERLYDYTKDAVKSGFGYYGNENKITFYCYAKSSVTYNNNGIISIKIETFWYAGGVSNTDVYGLNYSLKTGKKLRLTDVCSGGASKIKESIISKMYASEDYEAYDMEKIYQYKTKKFRFYLKPNRKAVVCFGPYEISYGGWYRTFEIESKYD